MKSKIMLSLLLIGSLLAMGACGEGKQSEKPEENTDVIFGKNDYQKIIAPNNELGFKLLPEVEADSGGNVFISPTSLLMALSMIYNGAEGETKEEIARALQAEGIEIEELNKANASLMSNLQKKSDAVQLSIANSIWLNNNYHFQKDFAQHNRDYFNAEIEEIDITKEQSAEKINDWVKNATNEKIKEMVEPPLDPDMVAYLLNAIYFKGDWLYAFNEENTEIGQFHLEDGSAKKMPLMFLKEELLYMENELFQAGSLPYGEEEMSMKVFLPKEGTDLKEFQNEFTAENWAEWKDAFAPKNGSLLLPKFQLEYETVLNVPLQQLGMKLSFGEGADFSHMIEEDDPLWISVVKQKTFLDVNEKGTEAAAATGITVVTESAPMDEPFRMEVNRPFFIAITDNETDAILFMGFISNPEESK